MATFNSAQNGNWNTDATWAEASHPTANDDVVIITHEVTYDVGVSAVTWGNCTINSSGILIFPIAASSKMLFNTTGILTVNSGGELRAGTSGAPIGSAYLCQIHWPQGSALRYTLVLNDGGKIDIYGDPDYYGATKTAILDSEWDASAGLTLYVEGDYSAKWVAGQHFIIHDLARYSNYNTDAEVFEIDSVGAYDAGNDRTPIVVTAAGGNDTFIISAKLWMLDRNVELLDPGSSWTLYGYGSYTERIRFDNNQNVARGAASNLNINEALFRGWEKGVDGGDGFTLDGSVFLNCAYALRSDIYTSTVDCLIASCNYASYFSTFSEIELDIIGCYNGLEFGATIKMTGDIISCFYGIGSGADNFYLIGNIFSCNRGVNQADNVVVIGDINTCTQGLHTAFNMSLIGDITDCATGVFACKSLSQIGGITDCGGGIQSPTGVEKHKNGALSGNSVDIVSMPTNTTLRAAIFEDYTIGGTKRELQIYANAGIITSLHNGDGNWQVPPSGESFILEATPNTYCNVLRSEWLSLSSDPLNMMFAYVTSGEKTLTFKIYPVGWTSSLDNDDVVLEAFYLDGAGVTRTMVVNTTATYANGGWRDLSVSFTAGQDGLVYFVIHIKKYEAGDYVLIDPEWSVS